MSGSTPTAEVPIGSVSRWVWPWWIVLLPLILVPLLALRPAEDGASLDPLPMCVQSAHEGGQEVRSQVTIVVFDVSTSVIAGAGADPNGRSFSEARLLARALAESPCTADDRMGAVIFASSSVEIPPIPLSSLSVIESAIKRPPQSEIGGGTNLSGALSLVGQVADRYPDHDVTVVVLSDMQVENTAQVSRALSNLRNHNLHLVALGAYDTRFDGAFDTVATLINEVAPGDIAGALAAAITHTRKDTNR